MYVYRIAASKYIKDISGAGARSYGGRWNEKGIAMLYTSESRALACLETLVHMPISLIPDNLAIATIFVSDRLNIEKINISDLPRNWKDYPAPEQLADIGNKWIASMRSPLLKVPSVVIEEDFNILINPQHLEAKKISITETKPFFFSKRFF